MRFAVPACLCCLGNAYLQPSNLLPYTGPLDGFPVCQHLGEGRISLRRGGTVICFLSYHDGSASSLARIDQTDVGVSSALPLALASSVLPKLRLLTRLAVRSVRLRGPDGVVSVSVFRPVHVDDLGLLCTPAVVGVRAGLR